MNPKKEQLITESQNERIRMSREKREEEIREMFLKPTLGDPKPKVPKILRRMEI